MSFDIYPPGRSDDPKWSVQWYDHIVNQWTVWTYTHSFRAAVSHLTHHSLHADRVRLCLRRRLMWMGR